MAELLLDVDRAHAVAEKQRGIGVTHTVRGEVDWQFCPPQGAAETAPHGLGYDVPRVTAPAGISVNEVGEDPFGERFTLGQRTLL